MAFATDAPPPFHNCSTPVKNVKGKKTSNNYRNRSVAKSSIGSVDGGRLVVVKEKYA